METSTIVLGLCAVPPLFTGMLVRRIGGDANKPGTSLRKFMWACLVPGCVLLSLSVVGMAMETEDWTEVLSPRRGPDVQFGLFALGVWISTVLVIVRAATEILGPLLRNQSRPAAPSTRDDDRDTPE